MGPFSPSCQYVSLSRILRQKKEKGEICFVYFLFRRKTSATTITATTATAAAIRYMLIGAAGSPGPGLGNGLGEGDGLGDGVGDGSGVGSADTPIAVCADEVQ